MLANLTASEFKVINFALLSHSKIQEQTLRALFTKFEQAHPNIKIRIRKLHASDYPKLYQKFTRLESDIDIIQWFAGERLKQLTDDNKLLPINNIWKNGQLEAVFSQALQNEVKFEGNYYGLPITSYAWGFYYKKSLFKRLKLNEPATWQEFQDLLASIKSNQISPIGIGSNNLLHVAGWFDYLMLRINGQQKYRALVSGQLSFNSPEVIEAFTVWRNLLENNYFFAQHKFYDGSEIMPLLYREVIGLNLNGSFSHAALSTTVQSDLGFFAFPEMNIANENSLVAPTSELAVTKGSDNKPEVEKLVQYFAQIDTQTF